MNTFPLSDSFMSTPSLVNYQVNFSGDGEVDRNVVWGNWPWVFTEAYVETSDCWDCTSLNFCYYYFRIILSVFLGHQNVFTIGFWGVTNCYLFSSIGGRSFGGRTLSILFETLFLTYLRLSIWVVEYSLFGPL